MSNFSQKLAIGKVGESAIAQWLKHRGHHVMPVYELEVESGKGPQLFSAEGEYIAPDMFVFKSDGTYTCWIEAKRKTRFSWWNIGKCFETGIDLHHWDQYCKVQEVSPWTIWIMFLHTQSDTWQKDIDKWNAPPTCPTGLFGNRLTELKKSISHTDPRHGKTGMVYWKAESLLHLAALEEIEIATKTKALAQSVIG